MLTHTTSCDEGLRADLCCDTRGVIFDSPDVDPRNADAVWQAASALGWTAVSHLPPTRHRCPGCRDSGRSASDALMTRVA